MNIQSHLPRYKTSYSKASFLGRAAGTFTKPSIETRKHILNSTFKNSSADALKLSPNALFRKENKSIIESSDILNTRVMKSKISTFLSNTGDDQELLNLMLKRQDLFKNNSLQTTLNYTNNNNKIILKKILENPDSLKCCYNRSEEPMPINNGVLNLLLALNRNNTNVEALISSSDSMTNFINKALGEIWKLTYANYIISALSSTGKGIAEGTTSYLNKNFLDDLENLVHGKPYYAKFSSGEDIEQIISQTKIGDAFSIDGIMHINEGNGIITSLEYNEKVFERLFPAAERFNSCQGKVGDCHFVSPLHGIMMTPKGRNELYKLFKNSTEDEIIVNNFFKFQGFDKENKHIVNETGLAILEQYGGYDIIDFYPGPPEHAMRMLECQGADHELALMSLLPHEKVTNITPIGDAEKFEKELISTTQKENGLFTFATNAVVDNEFQKKFHLPPNHANLIVTYNPKYRVATVSNPHMSGLEMDIELDELLKNVGFNCLFTKNFGCEIL